MKRHFTVGVGCPLTGHDRTTLVPIIAVTVVSLGISIFTGSATNTINFMFFRLSVYLFVFRRCVVVITDTLDFSPRSV